MSPASDSDLLDPARIRARLPIVPGEWLRKLEVHEKLASTNDHLLAVNDLPPGRFDACLAEVQSEGRGRRGRRWIAPFASGICLSINWGYRDAPASLGALSLAAGVAVLRALRGQGATKLGLKWPNDIVCPQGKVGGVLVDLRGDAAGPTYLVVGIGINVRLPQATLDELRAAGVDAADLASLELRPGRNHLAAALISELALALSEFGARGMTAFAEEWRAADALAGHRVRVLQGGEPIEGLARGIDADGALLVDVAGESRRILSGEVSVRQVR